jgi:hypothetical protein
MTKKKNKIDKSILVDAENQPPIKDYEAFAAKIANKQDNPTIEEETHYDVSTQLKPFGRGGFGQGKPDDPMYLKDLQRNRILKKLDLIKDKLGDMKQIIVLLEEQLTKLK